MTATPHPPIGHAQVAVLADRGRGVAGGVDGGVVVRLVPEQKVVRHRDGKDGASPRERARSSDQRVVVLSQQRARARLAVAPFLVLPTCSAKSKCLGI